MINTNINPNVNTTSKTEVKEGKKGEEKSSSAELSSKEALTSALRKNLSLDQKSSNQGSNQSFANSEELNLKLKSLVNKILNEIGSKQGADAPLIKQSAPNINFAANFSNELKFLSTQMQNKEIFAEILQKLESILKPASEAKASDLGTLFKNSGIFFETKLKDALNEQKLPSSFHSLINAVKALSSEKISHQIIALADENLDAKNSLEALKQILSNAKGENKEILNQSAFKSLLKLSNTLENARQYISKNPALVQGKIINVASNLLTKLEKIEPELKNQLTRPQNLALKDTSFLKELHQSFENVKNTLKNLIKGEKTPTNNPTLPNNAPKPNANLQTNQALNTPKQEPTLPNLQNPAPTSQEKAQPNSQTNAPKNEPNFKPTEQNQAQPNKANEIQNKPQPNTNEPLNPAKQNASQNTNETKNPAQANETSQKPQNEPLKQGENVKQNENLKQNENTRQNENLKPQNQNEAQKTEQPKNANQAQNTTSNTQTKQAQNQASPFFSKNTNQANLNQNPNISNSPNSTPNTAQTQNLQNQPNVQPNQTQTPLPNSQNLTPNQTQQGIKNLIFLEPNQSFDELENLSKNLGKLNTKINESLRVLDEKAKQAKTNLGDIKNIENKTARAAKELNQIALKDEKITMSELKNDVKSTLLQSANLAKNIGDDSILNTANRLLAQIELNQLLSLANDSINSHLPYFWEDLEHSKLIFKRGKKDKFYAQIKLNFAKLGELDALIALHGEKYIDINLMVENKEFRKLIYENAHELKRAINKAGLLSANFFVSDLVRPIFDSSHQRDYEIEMGVDKEV